MSDPKKSIQSDGNHVEREQGTLDLYSGLLRRLADANRLVTPAPAAARLQAADDLASADLSIEQFRSNLERVSRSNDAIRESWRRVTAKLAAAEQAGSAASIEPLSEAWVHEAGAAAVRLLAGFRIRLADLVKGWAATGPAVSPGLSGVAFAAMRGVNSDNRMVTGDGERSFVPSSSLIEGASWARELRWLTLDWSDVADTNLLKESGSVDVFVESAGQRRRVAANFRPTSDGSVDIRHVVVHLSADEAESLAGADVDVAWVSDVDGKAQRLLVVFHADPPQAD